MKSRTIRCQCGATAEPPVGMSRIKFAYSLAVHNWQVVVEGVKVVSAKCDACVTGKRAA